MSQTIQEPPRYLFLKGKNFLLALALNQRAAQSLHLLLGAELVSDEQRASLSAKYPELEEAAFIKEFSDFLSVCPSGFTLEETTVAVKN